MNGTGVARRKGVKRTAASTTANLESHLMATDGGRASKHRTPLYRTEEVVGYAPTRPEDRVCQSTNGRWRAEHSWDLDEKCVFCPAEKAVDW